MSKLVYAWKPGARASLPAAVVGQEIERVRKQHGGFFTPASLVDAARPNDAPLHPAFEWDDTKAADLYRGEQARYLIRTIVVVNQSDEEAAPMRAFVSVQNDDGQCYTSISKAMSNPELRDQVLTNALRDMQSFERKYSRISVLAGVVREIKKATRVIVEKEQRVAA